MKKYLAIAFVLFVSILSISAQRRTGLLGERTETTGSLFVSYGAVQCQDDTYGNPLDYPFYSGHNFEFTLGYLQTIGENNFAYRMMLQYGNLKGMDSPTRFHFAGFESYNANLIQFSGRGEYYYKFGGAYRVRKPHTVYAFAGIGTLLSSVDYPPVDGYKVYLGKSTPSLAFFIPIGFGYKYDITNTIAIGTEFCEKIVFSDMVDGYEGSHIPGVKQVYDNMMTVSLSLYYKFF